MFSHGIYGLFVVNRLVDTDGQVGIGEASDLCMAFFLIQQPYHDPGARDFVESCRPLSLKQLVGWWVGYPWTFLTVFSFCFTLLSSRLFLLLLLPFRRAQIPFLFDFHFIVMQFSTPLLES